MKRLKSHFYRFAVLGGDMRQVYLAELLEEKEYQVQRYGLTGGNEKESCSLEACLKMAQVVVAPIPFLREGVVFSKNTEKKILPQELLLHTRPGSILFAGGIPKEYEKQAKEKGIICVDYLKDGYTAVKNTIATAEGSLAEAIIRSSGNLTGSNCLVIGYGKCGSTLVSYLKKFSCTVFVADKEEKQRIKAQLFAGRVLENAELPQYLENMQYIFNTAPALVLCRAFLEYVPGDTLILDLASAPGGVDYEAAKQRQLQVLQLPGLPGRYAPYASAKILAEAIERYGKQNL